MSLSTPQKQIPIIRGEVTSTRSELLNYIEVSGQIQARIFLLPRETPLVPIVE